MDGSAVPAVGACASLPAVRSFTRRRRTAAIPPTTSIRHTRVREPTTRRRACASSPRARGRLSARHSSTLHPPLDVSPPAARHRSAVPPRRRLCGRRDRVAAAVSPVSRTGFHSIPRATTHGACVWYVHVYDFGPNPFVTSHGVITDLQRNVAPCGGAQHTVDVDALCVHRGLCHESRHFRCPRNNNAPNGKQTVTERFEAVRAHTVFLL